MADRVSNEKILKVITDFKTTGFQDALNALKSIEGEANNLSNTFKQFSTDSSSVFKQLTQSLTNFTNPVKEQFSSLNDVVRKTMDEVKSKFDAFKKTSGMGKLKEAIQAMDVRGVGNTSLSKELSDLDKEVRVLYKDIESKLSVAVTRLSKKVADGKLSVEQKNKVMERYAYLLSRNVNPSLEGFGTRLTEIKQKILAATESTQKAGSVFEGFGNRMKVFLQYRAINSMVSSLRDLAGAAVELESSFANIQAITSASDLEMTKLKDTILRVGDASKYSVQEIANATTMLGQAGLSADEINNVLETTTQLAAATGSDLSSTVDLMTSALAVWGLNSEEASHLSDVMVTGMNRTKATLDTFRMAVQYAGATVASLNGDFEDLASVSAAVSNAGLRASVVGTGLRATIAELTSPTKKMTDGLAKLGLTTKDVDIKSRGLIPVLESLKDAGLDASTAYSMFGRRSVQFVLAAINQKETIDELNNAFRESGSTLNAYNKQMDTVASQWVATANTIKNAAFRISEDTRGFIANTLRYFRQGLDELLKTEEDPMNERQNIMSEGIRNAQQYLSKLDKLKDNKNIDKINSFIADLNKTFSKDLPLIKNIDDLNSVLSETEKTLRGIEKAEIDAFNKSNIDEMFDIREREFNKVVSEINKGLHGGIEYNLKGGKKNAWNVFETQRESYLKDIKAGGSPAQIESDINAAFSSWWPSIEEVILKKIHIAALDAAEKEAKNVEEFAKPIELKSDKGRELKDKAETLIASLESLDDSIFGNVENIKLTANSLDKIITEKAKEKNDLIDEINKAISKDGEITNKKEIENISGYIAKTTQAYDSWIAKLLSDSEKMFDAMSKNPLYKDVGDAGLLKTNELQKINGTKNNYELIMDKLNIIPSPKSSYRAGDSLRDAAKKFNERYAQTESQSQSLAYDIRKEQMERQGYQTRLSKLDTTGTLSKAYSRTSGKIADLEALKTAKQNVELLKTYKKDYGSLLEDVESNKVTLAEADKQSDGLISKMRELELSTTEATARFGDLDKVDLSDIDSKIESLNDKLTKINESIDDPLKAGFQGFKVTIEEMADTYSAAGIGSMIAQDLGNGVSDALYSLSQGTKSMKDAFSDMARSILQDISKMLIRMAVLKSMEAGLASFSGGGNVQAPTQGQLMMGAEYASGGFIPKIRAALGTPVRGGTPGKDSVPAMLMPGEYVLKKSAVDALGTNFLNDLNNNAAQTLTNTSANLLQNPYEQKSESEPSVVNVWVVSKEEEAKMGPNDIIATIGRDIMTGGQTRRLIQSVVAGRK